MATNRMDLVCTVCGEALELASYSSENLRWGITDLMLLERFWSFFGRHQHGAETPATSFQLAFEAEQEG